MGNNAICFFIAHFKIYARKCKIKIHMLGVITRRIVLSVLNTFTNLLSNLTIYFFT